MHVLPKFMYLGAGAKHRVLAQWLRMQKGIARYIDLTAGSCNQPYAIARSLRVPVITNDGNYYSYSIGRAVLQRQRGTAMGTIFSLIDRAANTICEGHCALRFKDSKHRTEAVFYDTLINEVNNSDIEENDKAFLLAVIGHSILSNLSYRAVGWSDGVCLPLDKLKTQLVRLYREKNYYHVNGHHENQTLNVHLQDAISQIDFTDATVNIDPAWPYVQKETKNPYTTYIELSEMLTERPWKTFPFWMTEDILGEFVSIVKKVLDKNAREFYVWNQTTNHPSKKQLIATLTKNFSCEEVLNVKHHKAVGDHQEFQDYVLRIRA